MLVGICGSICAGKNSVQNYLIARHEFQPLLIKPSSPIPDIEKSTSDTRLIQTTPAVKPRQFEHVQALLDYATINWSSKFVTTSIYDESTLETLSHRPFFILIHVDAPLSTRFERFKSRCDQSGIIKPSLERFVDRNDRYLFSPGTGLAAFSSRAQIKLLNTTTSITQLYKRLDDLNITDESRLRPKWDQYFMTLASLAARRSNCMRRQVGCVLVREARVISTGYNGTPRFVRNCNEGGCPRCNDGGGAISGGAALSTCLCIHAEENALLEAGRERVGGGAVLYCNTCPCLTCTIKIVQVGITEVVYSRSYYMDAEAAKIFEEAGVKLRQFSPPAEGVFSLCDDGDVVGKPRSDRKLINGQILEEGQ